MTTPLIVTGDDVSIPAQLKKNGAAFAIPIGATVKARLVSINSNITYTAEILQSSDAPGADWATALVVVQFVPENTQSITFQGKARLEIQVDDGMKLTWFLLVEIRRGNIA